MLISKYVVRGTNMSILMSKKNMRIGHKNKSNKATKMIQFMIDILFTNHPITISMLPWAYIDNGFMFRCQEWHIFKY